MTTRDPVTIDSLLDTVWSPSSNCLDFVADAWPKLTGRPFPTIRTRIAAGLARPSMRAGFRRLVAPRHGAVVLFEGGAEHHVGIYWGSRVLHLTRQGVQYQPLEIARLTFTRVRFYAVR